MKTHSTKKLLYLMLLLTLVMYVPQAPAPSHAGSSVPLVTSYTYNANGTVKTRTDAMGAVTTYSYDQMNRLVTIKYPDMASVSFTYDQLGRRTSMADALGTTRYEYDIHDRLTGITDPHGYALRYEYNSSGLPSKLYYPDGSATSFTWDGSSRLVAVQDTAGRTAYQYDQANRVASRTLPNGVTTHYEYNPTGAITAIQHNGPAGAPMLTFNYTLNAAGNPTKIIQTENGGAPRITTFDYDALNRLTGASYPDGEVMTYKYDPMGNRLEMGSTTQGATQNTQYQYNSLGQLTRMISIQGTETFNYNPNGNLIQRTIEQQGKPPVTIQYSWNSANQLTEVNNGLTLTRTSFGYDGDGRLLERVQNGVRTNYVQQGNLAPQVLLAVTGGKEARAPMASPHVGEDVAGNRLFYLEDGFHDIAGFTDTSGNLKSSVAYDPFGGVRMPDRHADSLRSPLLGASVLFDDRTNIVFQQNRYYDTTTARYLNPNPPPSYQANTPTINLHRDEYRNLILFPDPFNSSRYQTTLFYDDVLRINGNQIEPGFDYRGFTREVAKGLLTQAAQGVLIPPQYHQYVNFASLAHDLVTLPVQQIGPSSLLRSNTGLNAFVRSVANDPYKLPSRERAEALKEAIHLYMAANPYCMMSRCATLLDVLAEYSSPEQANVSVFDLAREEGRGGQQVNPTHLFPPSGGDGVGGVSLDLAAEVLVDLTDITGAFFDPTTGQVVLVGREDSDKALPAMDPDDLAVAIRSVYAGEDPGVTMVPVDPSGNDRTQRVEYFGATEQTHFGYILFEADRYLKSLAAGKDTLTGQPLTPGVPGFKSEIQLALDYQMDTPWHRNWFVPAEILMKQSEDGNSIVFDNVKIKVESRFIQFQPDGSHVDIPGTSPVTDQFTAFLTEHYSEFAAEKPELAELERLARIVGIVKWIKDNEIPLDLSWLSSYHVKEVDTPLTTPGAFAELSAPTSTGVITITSFGGVDLSTGNTYISDDDEEATELKETAISARPISMPAKWKFRIRQKTMSARPVAIPVSWRVQEDDTIYTAVALNLAPTAIPGGYTTTQTDLSLPAGGGLDAAITRHYSSLDSTTGVLGRGWSLPLPSLEFRAVSSQADPNSYSTEVVLTYGARRTTFELNTDGVFRPISSSSPYEALGLTGDDRFVALAVPGLSLAPGIPGQPPEVRDGQERLLKYEGFALISKDGFVMAFDPSGRIHAIKSPGGAQLSYAYDGDRLIAITGAGGAELLLDYTEEGRLAGAKISGGRQVRYTYDAGGNLSGVYDETNAQLAAYSYDAAGRLTRVEDRYGQVAVENSYDDLGRVTGTQSGHGYATTVEYDRATNSVTHKAAGGGSYTYQYDTQNRLVKSIDPSGNAVLYEYGPQDYVTRITDKNGNATTYNYDDDGLLREIVSPLGDRTQFLGYNLLGLPQAIVDPTGRATMLEYDGQGHITGVRTGLQMQPDGSFVYDEGALQVASYEYDLAGQLIAIHDASGMVTRITRDATGRPTEITPQEGSTIKQTYDASSRLTSFTAPGGYQVELGYTPEGELSTIKTPAGTSSYGYSSGRLASVTDPMGQTVRYEYDAVGQLTQISDPGGARTKLEYDSSGNLVAVVDALGARTSYTYDASGRLLSETWTQPSGSDVGRATVVSPASGGDPGSEAPIEVQPSPAPASTQGLDFWPIAAIAIVAALGLGLALFVVAAKRRSRRSRSKREFQEEWQEW
jgi:YD repeat-containing protein